jgi:hypothetical protein
MTTLRLTSKNIFLQYEFRHYINTFTKDRVDFSVSGSSSQGCHTIVLRDSSNLVVQDFSLPRGHFFIIDEVPA